MILDKRYRGNRLAGFHKCFFLSVQYYRFYPGGICGFFGADIFAPDLGVAVKIKRRCHYKSQDDLPKHLKPSRQTILVPFLVRYPLLLGEAFSPELEVIVNKSDHAKPDGAEDHQTDVSLIEVGQQE